MAYLERRYRAAAMPQPTEQDAGVVVKPDGDPTKPTTITQEQLDDILGRNGSYTEEFQPHARPVGEQSKARKASEISGGGGDSLPQIQREVGDSLPQIQREVGDSLPQIQREVGSGTIQMQPFLQRVDGETGGVAKTETVADLPADNAAGTVAGNNAGTVAQPVDGAQNNGQQVATNKTPYLADWSQGWDTVMYGRPASEGQEAIKAQDIPVLQAIVDYNRWAKENNGEKLDPFVIYTLLSQGDPNKSIEDNKKEEKRLKRKELFENLGNLLINTGNFAGAIMGAPAPANAPDSIELTARQRKLREYADAQRKATARDYLTIMRNQQADERAAELQKIRERKEDRADEEQKRKNALSEAQIGKYRAAEAKDEAMVAYYKTKEQAIIDGKPLEDALKEAKIAYEKAKTAKVNSGGSSSRSSDSSSNRSSGGSSRRSNGVPEYLEEITEVTETENGKTTRKYKQPRKSSGMSSFSIHGGKTSKFSIHK